MTFHTLRDRGAGAYRVLQHTAPSGNAVRRHESARENHPAWGLAPPASTAAGDYGARSTLITLMGQFSCYSGKQVTWDQISNSAFCHLPKPEDVRAGMDPPVKPGPDGTYPLPYTPGVSKVL